ncbi:hypothetical protein ACFL6A_04805, partial [bacterium]
MRIYHNGKMHIQLVVALSVISCSIFIIEPSFQRVLGQEWRENNDQWSELRPMLERFASDQSSLFRTYNLPMSEKYL